MKVAKCLTLFFLSFLLLSCVQSQDESDPTGSSSPEPTVNMVTPEETQPRFSAELSTPTSASTPTLAIIESGSSTENWISPGDKIGEMGVEQGEPTLPYPSLWQFCDPLPDSQEPLISTSECSFPTMSGITVELGWIAKESRLEDNWDALAWEVTLDGRKLALHTFQWIDMTFIAHNEDNEMRRMLIDLKKPTLGVHTLQIKLIMETSIDDGFKQYQSGAYEHTVTFTVVERPFYESFEGFANKGVQLYHSEEANLDFLLYLPDNYSKDIQKTWPMIIFLHGALLRGATLELLMQEPLPAKLVHDSNFPFVVMAPLGDGGYEFWSEEKMTLSLLALMEEVQAAYSMDLNRIFLTGSDMGGNGVWAIGLQHPDLFAALAPISGYAAYPFDMPENICDLKDVPVWVFHGKRDELVPIEVTQNLVDALLACGGDVQLSISPDMRNDVQYNVYSRPELFDWFLSQSKK